MDHGQLAAKVGRRPVGSTCIWHSWEWEHRQLLELAQQVPLACHLLAWCALLTRELLTWRATADMALLCRWPSWRRWSLPGSLARLQARRWRPCGPVPPVPATSRWAGPALGAAVLCCRCSAALH